MKKVKVKKTLKEVGIAIDPEFLKNDNFFWWNSGTFPAFWKPKNAERYFVTPEECNEKEGSWSTMLDSFYYEFDLKEISYLKLTNFKTWKKVFTDALKDNPDFDNED